MSNLGFCPSSFSCCYGFDFDYFVFLAKRSFQNCILSPPLISGFKVMAKSTKHVATDIF